MKPAIASDGEGGGIVTWTDYRRGAGYGTYVQHVLSSGEVDRKWPSHGLPVCTVNEARRIPGDTWAIVSGDGKGNAIVGWLDYRDTPDPFPRPYFVPVLFADLYAQRILRSGKTDPAWPDQGQPISLAPGAQWYPAVTTDGRGGAIFAWLDTRNSSDPSTGAWDTQKEDVYAQRVTRAGRLDVGRHSHPVSSDLESGEVAESTPSQEVLETSLASWLRAPRSAETRVHPPNRFLLAQNQPNPFGPSTTIRFELPVAAKVKLEVFDLHGRRLLVLADSEFGAGYHSVDWDRSLEDGRRAAPGVYVCRISAGSFLDEKKMILLP